MRKIHNHLVGYKLHFDYFEMKYKIDILFKNEELNILNIDLDTFMNEVGSWECSFDSADIDITFSYFLKIEITELDKRYKEIDCFELCKYLIAINTSLNVFEDEIYSV